MQVSEFKLHQILEGSKQYQVPLYQRRYSWKKKQLERLWGDITALAEARKTNPSATHFTGSLVLAVGSVSAGSSQFLVVDGQQRLTTLTILLASLRDLLKESFPTEPQRHESITNQYLINQYAEGADRLKVLPTQSDRSDYLGVVTNQISGFSRSNIIDAYQYFRSRLEPVVEGHAPLGYDEISNAVLQGLDFVSITANDDDNVYRIFESLNNTGLSLTQGDLLRNFIFMKLGKIGEELYSSTWMPMQNRLSPKDLEQLFWIELSWSNSEIKQGDIYEGQVARLKNLGVFEMRSVVEHFNELSVLLSLMRSPENEPSNGVRNCLKRLLDYGMASTDPLVLRILELRRIGKVTDKSVVDTLQVLESFLVRRLIVNAPHNALSRMMLRASDELDENDLAVSLRRYLSFGRKRYATNDQVAKAVVQEAFYYAGRPGQRKTILGWLEAAIAGKEPADLENTSIEHIMPQKFSLWREDLGNDLDGYESVEEMHEALVHTIANLSLTGYNSELSNKPFSEKRPQLEASNIALNQEIAENKKWGRSEIIARGDRITKLISQHWIPPIESADNLESAIDPTQIAEVLAVVPDGAWATYGDVAAAIGSSPTAIEDFLSSNPLPRAWRVLKASGAVGGHKYQAPDDTDLTPRELLEKEGVDFDNIDHASPKQRVSVETLMSFISADMQAEDDATHATRTSLDLVAAQIASKLSPPTWGGLEDLLEVWSESGGEVLINTADESPTEVMFVNSTRLDLPLVRVEATPAGQLQMVVEGSTFVSPFSPEQVDSLVDVLGNCIRVSDDGNDTILTRSWSSGSKERVHDALAKMAGAGV